jgi:hypothetical protein
MKQPRKDGSSEKPAGRKGSARPFLEDPEMGDEKDPAYRREMFETFKHMGCAPDDIRTDPKMKKEYAEWLKKPHAEEDHE